MSLRITPAASNPKSTSNTLGAPSAPGVHDTLRSNLGLTAASSSSSSAAASSTTEPQLQSAHPLEARLAKWRSTQDALKMEGLRRTFGMAEPIRRGMEIKLTAAGEWRPAAVGGTSNVHGDILAGRDTEVGWEDVYNGGDEFRGTPDFHTEMEARMKMNW